MTEPDFTTTELEALNAAFSGHTWAEGTSEPDDRVTVLVDAANVLGPGPSYLCRHKGGWAWVFNAKQLAETEQLPATWEHATDGLDTELRLPNATELSAGGWTIKAGPPQDEEQESLPFAAEQVLSAAELLERDDDHQLTLTEVMEAQARAFTSIAATMLDLHGLIEDELAWRRSQRPDPEAVEEEETDSAHRSLGPTEDPGFSFTGR